MQKQILSEIKQLRLILSKLIGTSELPQKDWFSKDSLDKAAKRFQKMHSDRSEWVKETDIGRYLKDGGWMSGKFIRVHFRFTGFIKQGHYYLYRKNDLIALNKALKERNVILSRYIEYMRDQADFKKKLTANKMISKGKRPYELPIDLKDITTSSPPLPDAGLVKKDLEELKEEFFAYKLAEYIDIYSDNHAMLKTMYYFEKYLDPDLKRRIKRWCDNFNYANHALELITKKKDIFVPIREEEMIQL